MSAMEQSLRRALDAGDASDPAFRETIYAASERALERMLRERPMDEEAAQAQRIRLAETINRVEQDYYVPTDGEADPGERPLDDADAWNPAEEPDEGAGEGREPAAARTDAAEAGRSPIRTSDAPEPSGDRPPTAQPQPADASGDRVVDDQAPSFLRRSSDPVPERPKVSGATGPGRTSVGSGFGGGGKAPSGRFRKIFALIVVLAFVILAYLVYGMIYGSSPAPTTGAATSDAAPSDEGRWIALFDGTQLASIATPAGGRVETVTGAGDRPAVRMTSAGEGSEIEVAVGPGVARELAGETVRVEVTVGSPDGAPREFGVRCLFSGETTCGRQRFTTVQSSEAFVFEMAVPRGTRNAGSIAFEPGFGGGRSPLDLYGVRARLREAA